MNSNALATLASRSTSRDSTTLEPLLVGRRDAAKLCSVSPATFDRWVSAGMTPKPIKLAGRLLFSFAELREWVAAGCPDRATWNAINEKGGDTR